MTRASDMWRLRYDITCFNELRLGLFFSYVVGLFCVFILVVAGVFGAVCADVTVWDAVKHPLTWGTLALYSACYAVPAVAKWRKYSRAILQAHIKLVDRELEEIDAKLRELEAPSEVKVRVAESPAAPILVDKEAVARFMSFMSASAKERSSSCG